MVAVIGVLAFAVLQAAGGGEPQARGVEQEQDQDPDLPGQWIDPGAEYPNTAPHVSGEAPFCEGGVQKLDGSGKATCLTSNPPTSGPHNASPARWGVYGADDAVPKENFVHNMEHAGVVVTYNCTNCDEVVGKLRDIVEGYLNDGRLVVMTPYTEMDPETIALASWGRLEKFPVGEFDEGRVRRYIEAHERRFNPEGL